MVRIWSRKSLDERAVAFLSLRRLCEVDSKQFIPIYKVYFCDTIHTVYCLEVLCRLCLVFTHGLYECMESPIVHAEVFCRVDLFGSGECLSARIYIHPSACYPSPKCEDCENEGQMRI